MKLREKLRATLVQTFGTARLDESVRSAFEAGVAGVDDATLPQEGDVVGGCYRLVSRLGEGMFGRVYVAERTDVPEHRVALKVMSRAAYAGRNVERELVMLAAATHPHIVQLKDHGVTDDYVWLTMPLYHGETLLERLDRGPLTLREAHAIFLPIARGVQSLHARGLRHQDIKPDNIFLATFEDAVHPVLLDLGVAVEQNATFVAGTALYAAPEQIIALGGLKGDARLDERMDVYCLATTLLRSLVGEERFPGAKARTPYEIASAFAERERHPLADDALPGLRGEPRARLVLALQRWMTSDAARRPTAEELATQLDVLLEQEREAARVIEQNLARQEASYRRMRGALTFVVVGTVAAALFGVSKRETLRLAAELERERALGAASFDKLDTCVAAHQIAERETASCRDELAAATARHADALRVAETSLDETSDGLTRKLSYANTMLNRCEAESEQAAAAWAEERAGLAAERQAVEQTLERARSEWKTRREELEQKRSEAEQATERCATTREACEAAKDAIAVERDACFLALPAAPAAAKPAPPALPADPGAKPSVSAPAEVKAKAAPPAVPPTPPPAAPPPGPAPTPAAE
ncbi:MAG: serine/threonine-protein kinase [Polyangiaceae bacterium]